VRMADTRGDENLAERIPLWETVWPKIGADDSESLRHRKLAVRAGQLAMVCMVFVAAGVAPLARPEDYPVVQIAGLALAGGLFVWWNLVGTRGIITLVLWERAEPPPPELRRPACGTLLYFVIQVGLAGFIYVVSDHGRIPNLVWLALLPPVSNAVFMLDWRGIATVATLMLLVLVLSIHRWHEWSYVGYAGLAFAFAVLFTIVFSLLAVQSEMARNKVQRLATELTEANCQLREYAVQAGELSATRERNRIAREIHDTLGHFLTVANVQLDAALALWAGDPKQAREAVLKAQAFTREGLQDIRRSVAALRNSPLDNKPLTQALQALVAAASTEKPAAKFSILGTPKDLSWPVELSLYRAAQEGLTNAHKHATAEHVRVILSFQAEGTVSLCVQDDGVGADDLAGSGGFGLHGLCERAQLLGGTVEIETAPNAGFTLKFEVPA